MTTTQWTGKNYRITFLTERLVRLEYQSEGRFEDRPTTAVQCRDFPPVTVREQRLPGRVELDTPFLHLSYDEKPFSPEGLSLSVKGGLSASMSDWRYGQPLSTLGGTARTLDQADGEIPVGDGLISRNGFSVLDDYKRDLLEMHYVNSIPSPTVAAMEKYYKERSQIFEDKKKALEAFTRAVYGVVFM